MLTFNVTYEILTQESAAEGDADERGFICEHVRLREAFEEVFNTRTSAVGGISAIEPSSSSIHDMRWITVDNGMEYETGAYESRSLHIPENATASTRRRIAHLMGSRI